MTRKPEAVKILSAATSTTTGDTHEPRSALCTFQASGTASEPGSATVVIQVSNVNTSAAFMDLATISLTLGTTLTADGFTMNAPWKYVRAKVTAISGADASVDAYLGVA